ncbi:MAG: zinc-finger domain-containing protein [Alphaproteobacteria bacterium]|nr:zinc-finger domain-containing protein [Alphaproteobacteria bacterium]
MTNILYVEQNQVSCEGTGISDGHPRIFLKLEPSNQVVCPYCSRQFILKAPADI